MSLFDLDGGGNWNYSYPEQPGYMESITGTVIKIKEVQSRNFQTKEPEFWDPATKLNPKLDLCLMIKGQSGKILPWQFQPKGLGHEALKEAIKNSIPGATDLSAVGGKLVRITTSPGNWGNKNPRPWSFEILGEGQFPFEGMEEFRMPVATQPVAPTVNPMTGQVRPPLTQQGFDAPQTQPQQQQVQPMQQAAPVPQAMPQAQQQPQFQEVPQAAVPQYYDEDIPF